MKKKHISHKSRTDWNRVDKLGDKDIDLSENPEVTPEMFAKAVLRKGLKPVTRKSQVYHLRSISRLPEFYCGSLPACHGLLTPADLHILAIYMKHHAPKEHTSPLALLFLQRFLQNRV